MVNMRACVFHDTEEYTQKQLFKITIIEFPHATYFLSSASFFVLSLTISPAPPTSISGKFSHGPASSLKSEASEALDDLRDEARLDVAVPRLCTCRCRKFNADNLVCQPPGLDVCVCSSSCDSGERSLSFLRRTNSFHAVCSVRAALSSRFQMRVDEMISSSLRVGNCFLNFTSICSCSSLKLSVSSTCPSTCLTRACKMSRQWILLPDEIAKLKETNATVLGFGIPSGGSREARKSETCVKWMNCVACGSYLIWLTKVRVEFVIDSASSANI